MIDQFVTYDIALKLKELGFDEECFGYYTPMKEWMMEGTKFNPERHFHGCNWANSDNTMYFMYLQNSFGDRTRTVRNSSFTKAIHNISVPLWQQVIDWFREIHHLHINFMIEDSYDVNDKTWKFEILNTNWGGDKVVYTLYRGKGFKTFNEMRESAICKSIDLIK